MGAIDDTCMEIVQNVEDAAACGVVHLESGALLGIYNMPGHTPGDAAFPSALNETIAAAACRLFRGSTVNLIERAVRAHRGEGADPSHGFEDVHVTSGDHFHFMRAIKGGRAAVVLVTRKSTNVGMGWAQLKSYIPAIEPLVR